MASEYNLLIIYCDNQEKVVERVSIYGYNENLQCFYFEKNGYNSFVPRQGVKFFGRESDYKNV